jgi:hypothetical protein
MNGEIPRAKRQNAQRAARKEKQSGGSVANVTHALKGIEFPARKSDLLDRANV